MTPSLCHSTLQHMGLGLLCEHFQDEIWKGYALYACIQLGKIMASLLLNPLLVVGFLFGNSFWYQTNVGMPEII